MADEASGGGAVGVVDVSTLTRWTEAQVALPANIDNPLETPTPLGPIRFNIDPKLNSKIILW